MYTDAIALNLFNFEICVKTLSNVKKLLIPILHGFMLLLFKEQQLLYFIKWHFVYYLLSFETIRRFTWQINCHAVS